MGRVELIRDPVRLWDETWWHRDKRFEEVVVSSGTRWSGSPKPWLNKSFPYFPFPFPFPFLTYLTFLFLLLCSSSSIYIKSYFVLLCNDKRFLTITLIVVSKGTDLCPSYRTTKLIPQDTPKGHQSSNSML